MNMLMRSIRERVHQLNAQEVSNMLWASSKLEHDQPQLVHALLAQVRWCCRCGRLCGRRCELGRVGKVWGDL